MRALTLDPALGLREVPDPVAAAAEAVVRVTLAGVCNTDLELARGYMGFHGTLGHEFVGVVESCAQLEWVGRRVNGEINLGCGACTQCRRDLARHCGGRRVLGILGKDGCFAERVSLPLRNLLRVPDTISDEAAVFVEPLAAAFEILEQVAIEPRDRVLVLGDGKLGLLICMVLATTGCELHLLGHHPSKLAIAARSGVRTWTDANRFGKEFDVVIEATGSPDALQRAIALTRPRGRLVLKSTFHGATSLQMAPLVIDELTLIGSRCGRFTPALEALQQGRANPLPLITETFALADGLRGFQRAAQPGVLKVLLAP